MICDSVDPHPDWPVRTTSQRNWHDLPHLGRPTRLIIRRFRRDGPDGRRSHVRPPGLIGPPFLMTERLARSAIVLCLEMPLAEVSRRLGGPARKLRALFGPFLTAFEARYRPEAAHALGIDGVHLHGDTYTVIADIEGNALIDLLPDHSVDGLVSGLAKMERGDLVGVIAMDASALERSAIRAAFPVDGRHRVVITLDRRHAIALVLKALTNLRKGLGFRQNRRRAVDGRRARMLFAHGRPQTRAMMEGLAAEVARDLAVSLEGGAHARL